MILIVLYVLGVIVILLVLDFVHLRRANRWQNVVPNEFTHSLDKTRLTLPTGPTASAEAHGKTDSGQRQAA